MEWFQDTARQDSAALGAFCEAFEAGNAADVEEKLVDAGMQTIFKFGIACYKKRCRVMLAEK